MIRLAAYKRGEFINDWILAAIGILATYAPTHITSLFSDKELTECSAIGRYEVKLHVDGEVRKVVVDDYFPCLQNTNEEYNLLGMPFCYDRANNQKFIWPILIEKALATEYGSYENLKNGTIDDALNLMTGIATFRFNLLSEEVKMKFVNGSLWRSFQRYSDKCVLMCAISLPKEMLPQDNEGIPPSQACVVLDVVQCDSHKLIELQSLWGDTFWKGSWNPNSPLWSRRIREIIAQHKAQKKLFKDTESEFSLEKAGEGRSFYLCLKDFLKYYETIFFNISFDSTWHKLVIQDSWTVGRSGGSVMNLESVRYNPQYLIKVMHPTEMFFLLHQVWPYHKLELPMVGFELYRYAERLIGDPENLQPELVGGALYAQERNVLLERTLQQGSYILLITTFYPDVWTSFTFTIWGKKHAGNESTFSYVRLN